MAATIDAETARRLHGLWRAAGDQVGWLITTGTWDNDPDHVLAVPHVTRRAVFDRFKEHASPEAQALCLRGDSVEAVRVMLPPGLVRFPRSPEDDPVIIEAWI